MNIRKIARTWSAIAMLVTGAFTMSAAESHPVGTDSAFVDRPAMRNWQADGERGLWIQTNSRWFYVRFPRGLAMPLGGVLVAFAATSSPRTSPG